MSDDAAPNCLVHGKHYCVCLGARFWMDRALRSETVLAESQLAREALKGMLDSQAESILGLLVEKRTLIDQLAATEERDAERIEALWELVPTGLKMCADCNGSGGIGTLCKKCRGVGRLKGDA